MQARLRDGVREGPTLGKFLNGEEIPYVVLRMLVLSAGVAYVLYDIGAH